MELTWTPSAPPAGARIPPGRRPPVSGRLGIQVLPTAPALAKELQSHQVENSRKVWINVPYKGVTVGRMRVDLVAGDSTGDVMIEVKALGELRDVDVIQALSYLRASRYQVGLLINFGGRELQVKRLANQPKPVPLPGSSDSGGHCAHHLPGIQSKADS